MTREEQIRQASIEYTYKDRPMYIGGGAFSEMVDEMNRNYAFEEGAKWADEHPNPNTIKKIFKFALEKTNFLIADNLESIDWRLLIKKSMEE